MRDPEFLDEARKQNFKVEQVLGEALRKVVAKGAQHPETRS
jgi:hypothetical protein